MKNNFHLIQQIIRHILIFLVLFRTKMVYVLRIRINKVQIYFALLIYEKRFDFARFTDLRGERVLMLLP